MKFPAERYLKILNSNVLLCIFWKILETFNVKHVINFTKVFKKHFKPRICICHYFTFLFNLFCVIYILFIVWRNFWFNYKYFYLLPVKWLVIGIFSVIIILFFIKKNVCFSKSNLLKIRIKKVLAIPLHFDMDIWKLKSSIS